MSTTIRFDDGATYEDTMGRWSQAVGIPFLDWLAPPPGAAWLDVGCGSGTFTRLIADRCSPAALSGIDPSAPQLDYARRSSTPLPIDYRQADAQALPFADASFDQTVMALVIFFVPDPAKGVSEMARVLRPGGTASAYAWDTEGRRSPFQPVLDELEIHGHKVPATPSAAASTLDAMHRLWFQTGFGRIETHAIDIALPFDCFESYWTMMCRMPRVGPVLSGLDFDQALDVRAGLCRRLAPDEHTAFTASARANAVRGDLLR